MKAFDIALKDLTRSFRSAFAVIFMFGVPLLVTGMFYFMFGNTAQSGGFDLPRTKVVIANMDAGGPKFQINPKHIPGGRKAGTMGDLIVSILESDDMVDLIEVTFAADPRSARASVDNQEAQVAIIIPSDFSKQFADVRNGKAVIEFYQDPTLTLGPAIMRSILNRFLDSMGGVSIAVNVFMDEASPSQYGLTGQVVQGYLKTSLASRLDDAVRTATIIQQTGVDGVPFDYAFKKSLLSWDEPPIAIQETTSLALQKTSKESMALAHTAPGMMLQFAIAGLLTAAQVIVAERKSRTLQRLLTTATRRVHIVLGHYLAIFLLIFTQFVILIVFAQFALKVDYLRVPAATLLVAFCAALCISALGLLIGILAQTEEQAIIFSLIPMFVFAGLGGAWMPLEVTGPTFQAIGHVSPVAWGMDGFENILARGLGFESVLLPTLALLGYAIVFFVLAVLRFRKIDA